MAKPASMLPRGTCSIEIFTPRSAAGVTSLLRTRLPSFAALGPTFVSVAGTASGGVLEIIEEVCSVHSLRAQLHLPRAELTGESASALIDRALGVGVRDVLVLGGTPGSLRPATESGFGSAAELVGFVKARYGSQLRVGVCGFPRGTSGEAGSYEADLAELAKQVRAGAERVVSLPVFDVEAHVRYIEDARAEGVVCPISPGLLPVLVASEFRRICRALHVTPPEWLAERLSKSEVAGAASPSASVGAVGTQLLAELAEGLARAGSEPPHIYTLNSAAALDALLGAGFKQLKHRIDSFPSCQP